MEASRGVVAAFGGFGASRESRRMYAPATADLPADSQPGATGELLAEAADAGAALSTRNMNGKSGVGNGPSTIPFDPTTFRRG